MPGAADRHLADCFLAAPFAENGWVTALSALAEATGAALAQIIGIGGIDQIRFNHLSVPPPPDMFAQFAAINGGSPDVNWRIAAQATPMQLVAEADYQQVRSQRRFSNYDDFVADHDMPHGCQTSLRVDGRSLLGLATLRTRRDGISSADERRRFIAAAPAVLRAVDMQIALEHQAAALLRNSLESMGAAAFVMDMAGHVLALTPSAEGEVTRAWLVGMRGRRLFAADPRHDAALQAQIAAVLNGRATAGRLWLPGRPVGALDQQDGAMLEIWCLPPVAWHFGFAPALVATLRRPRRDADLNAALLSTALAFSPREAEIGLMLCRGMARGAIAADRQVSIETVNSQIKSMFNKTGVNRESALIALMRDILG